MDGDRRSAGPRREPRLRSGPRRGSASESRAARTQTRDTRGLLAALLQLDRDRREVGAGIGAIAPASGNVKVVFAGRLRETPSRNADKGGIDRNVSADLFGYAGVGQTLTITRGSSQVAEDEQPL